MKNAKILKLLALALVACMAVALFAGCGGSETTSSQVSEPGEQDVFDAGGDITFEGEIENSTVSTGNQNQTASKGDDNTISAEINSDAEDQGGGLYVTDNEEIFKKIPVALKGKTVIFADWGEANAAEYQKVVKKFTADTGINVRMLVLSEGDFISKVSAQIAAGSPPDIAASNSTYPQALEVVQPLPKIFDINDGFWDPRVSEATKVGSKYYFVNTYNSPFTGGYVVYYNKKVYNNNGLTSPQDYLDKGQWTYENLFKCMQDAVKLGYNNMIESMTLAEQMGVSLINYDQKTGTFTGKSNDPKLVKALQYMTKAVDEGLTGGSSSTFANGRSGICMLGTYGLKYNGYFKELAPSDIGVVPLPTSYDGQKLTYMPLGYRGYGICKGAKNGEAAYYFLRYFLDLNKYEPAGAEIFANKVLEKYFRQTQLPLFQKSPLYFEYFQGALALINKGWGGGDWTAIRHSSSSQVAVELEKMQNVVDSAAAAATAKVKEFT